MKSKHWVWLLLLLCSLAGAPAHAHVNNKDIYEDASTGPYKLFVTIRPPIVIPGTAVVEVRSAGAPITGLKVTPFPMTGEGSTYAPVADALQRSPVDKQFYTGSFWLMQPGSWRLQFTVAGSAGVRTTAVPVPAIALQVLGMPRGTVTLLLILGAFLLVSSVAIVVAAARESRLRPGLIAPTGVWGRSVLAGTAGLLCALGLMTVGNRWWKASAATSQLNVFQPITLHPALQGNKLDLPMTLPPASEESRSLGDFILDHNHLMHLYVIREPQMDVIFHLHPDQVKAGEFKLALPAMPPGHYTLYADSVHANGFPETMIAKIDVPAGIPTRPLAGDDAEGTAQPLSAGMLGTRFRFPDGYTMVWDRPATLKANVGYQFRFTLLDTAGKPAPDMRYYMGMTGHAAFVKTDGTSFAHVHPEGSASMAAMMLANEKVPGVADSTGGTDSSMAGMSGTSGTPAGPVPNVVEFPYGFPAPGRYRIFIQMKHGDTVETGAFDALAQ